MSAERNPLRSRLTLLLAFLAVGIATTWAMRTAPQPNSDRYDYLARAWHLSRGEAPTPLVIYPLRLAFPGADALPAQNLTRPPLWPVLVSIPLRAGAGEHSGILVAALSLLGLLALVYRAAPDRHGALAALVIATSFGIWKTLLGGGPEITLTLLLAAVWTWQGSPLRWVNIAVLAGLGGLMPWLHPIGWVYLVLGMGARLWRDRPSTLVGATALALVIASPWYLQVGTMTGQPFSPLQGQAELAKAVYDGGGLGPYRSLEGAPSIEVVRNDPAKILRHVAHNTLQQIQHLDGWLSWPLFLVGLIGIRHDRWLALRDLVLIGLGLVIVSTVAFESRLLLPLLPVAALWIGVGAHEMEDLHWPAWIRSSLPALAVVPLILPLGPSLRPGVELHAIADELRDPPRAAVVDYGAAGTPGRPCLTDSSVLAWRARRPGVAIPDTPETLQRMLRMPALGEAPVLISSEGPRSWWFRAPGWAEWWDSREARPLDGISTGRIATTAKAPVPYVPQALQLGPADLPDSLQTIPAPIAVRDGLRLSAPALRSLLRMVAAAQAEGVHLRVTSAWRSFERQAQLYASARVRHGADQRWVAAPGTSEHQLGTTVDFCDAAMKFVTEQGFLGTDEGQWLASHAGEFGWIRSYTDENEALSGYLPEPWHYRYGVLDPAEDR